MLKKIIIIAVVILAIALAACYYVGSGIKRDLQASNTIAFPSSEECRVSFEAARGCLAGSNASVEVKQKCGIYLDSLESLHKKVQASNEIALGFGFLSSIAFTGSIPEMNKTIEDLNACLETQA